MELFQADSEALQECVKIFQGEAQSLEQALKRFEAIAENIRGNAWIGLGANQFFNEYDSELVPDAEKLINNLDMAANQLDRVAKQIDDGVARILAVAKAPV